MLDPQTRHIYLDELRPPAGYQLDRAVATTYSLDLLSLLMAPLSMALAESPSDKEALADPVALLEALRRTAGRFMLFCQQGRITVPKTDSKLYSYLEPSVVEVTAPFGGVFHPKIWLLRYSAEGEPPYYRFLCLSRNLTFDRSWDTVLALEGYLEERRNAFAVNHPLGDFIAALPGLAKGAGISPSQTVQQHVALLADEVRRVRFRTPEGFEGFRFLPSGIPGYRRPPDLGEFNRLLVLSPFLSENPLHPIITAGRQHLLISRVDSLDGLSPEAMQGLMERGTVHVMADEAQRPEEVDREELNHGAEDYAVQGDDLSGLHAKLYIAEKGWEARVRTGSLNATDAAWTGHNVEFMVELTGRRVRVGIEPFLGDAAEKHAFRNLLLPYQPPAEPALPDLFKRRLEQALDQARTAIASAGVHGVVTEEPGGTYSLTLRLQKSLALPEGVTGRCRPISFNQTHWRDLQPLVQDQPVCFSTIGTADLTSFLAVELTARIEGKKAAVAFVLNVPTVGMPSDREERILQSLISDRGRFLRYLLFLLAEGSETISPGELVVGGGGDEAAVAGPHQMGFPLLEELVRAYSRQPEKIQRIDALVRSLTKTEEGRSLLPEGFAEMWQAFLGVASEEGIKA